jgi:hypothetical protein
MAKKRKKGYSFEQGKFVPVNKDKYKGSYPITYRSSWEKKAFMYLDRNTKVVSWGSESVVIKYKDPSRNNSIHRYFTDLVFTIKKGDKLETYLVEIKPHAQTLQPKKGRKSEKTFLNESMTYIRNCAKWKAANKFCKRKGWRFIIWTEKELKLGS